MVYNILEQAKNSVFFQSVQQWIERQKLAREVIDLDDRTLRDIGITRCEMPYLIDGTYRGYEDTKHNFTAKTVAPVKNHTATPTHNQAGFGHGSYA